MRSTASLKDRYQDEKDDEIEAKRAEEKKKNECIERKASTVKSSSNRTCWRRRRRRDGTRRGIQEETREEHDFACSSFNSKARDPSSHKDAPQGVLVSICMNSRTPPANQRGPNANGYPARGDVLLFRDQHKA